MLGIGLVFNLVLVITFCALVRVRNRFGLQYSIPNNMLVLGIGLVFNLVLVMAHVR